MRETLEERFNKKWEPEPYSGCWLWTAAITPRTGYGALYTHRRYDNAHRVSWRIYRGDIPAGLFVCHSCDTRSCVNPDHLFLGTLADNQTDMAMKCRAGKKLWPQVVQQIRNASQTNSSRKLGTRFGVSKTTILHIRNLKTWKYL